MWRAGSSSVSKPGPNPGRPSMTGGLGPASCDASPAPSSSPYLLPSCHEAGLCPSPKQFLRTAFIRTCTRLKVSCLFGSRLSSSVFPFLLPCSSILISRPQLITKINQHVALNASIKSFTCLYARNGTSCTMLTHACGNRVTGWRREFLCIKFTQKMPTGC